MEALLKALSLLFLFVPDREEGYEEGMCCNRPDGVGYCPGTMIIEGAWCRCWLSAPCSGCMNSLHCPECGVYSGPDGDCYDMDR